MTNNPYDQLVAHDVDEASDRPRRVVSLRAAVGGCLLSAVVGAGATWTVLATVPAAPVAAIQAPTDHDPASQPPRTERHP